MTELILLNNNERITIDEKYGVAVENNIADIRDLERVTGGSSKSLYITGNEEVNTILGSLFNINFESQTFDIRKKQECELWSNNERLIKGFFQIIEIDYNAKNQYTYEVMVFDEQINFFLEIEENLITGNDDPAKDLDFSQYNHLWLKSNVEDSWQKGPMELPYFYALFNQSKSFIVNVDDYKPGFYLYSLIEQIFYKYGYRFESEFLNSDLFKEIFIPFSTGDGLPQISENEVNQRAFQATDECGRNIKSKGNDTNIPSAVTYPDFLDLGLPFAPTEFGNIFTSTFAKERMVIPFDNLVFEGSPNIFVPGVCGITQPDETEVGIIQNLTGRHDFNFEINGFISTATPPGDSQIFPFNDNYTGSTDDNKYGIRVELIRLPQTSQVSGNKIGDIEDVTNFALTNAFVEAYQDFLVDMPTVIGTGSSVNTPFNIQGVLEDVRLYSSEQYVIVIRLNRSYWATPNFFGNPVANPDVKTTLQLSTTQPVIVENSPKVTEVGEGDLIDLNLWLPQNFKQKDLLKGIFKMFNLKMMPSIDDDRTLIIEPRDKFYTMGDVIDANKDDDFYVLDKPSKYRLATDFQAKEIIFKYKDDSDSDDDDIGKRQLLDYKNEFKREYGEQRILFDNENLRQQRIIELPFASTIPARASQNSWNGIIRQYFCGLINADEPKNKTRILFKNVIDIEDAIVRSEGSRNQEMRQFVFSPGQQTNTANGIPVRQTETDFVATGTHFRGNNPSREPTFDLNFGRSKKLYSPFRTATDDNLYNTFWSNEISNIDEQRMLTAYFYISNDRYRRLKINDIIYFDKNEYSNYYIINRIVEYNAKTGEAKLELLTFEPELKARPTRPVDEVNEDLVIDGRPIRPHLDIGSDNDSSGDVITIGNANINTGAGSIVTGNENISLGDFNIISGERNINYSKQTTIKGDDNFIGNGSKGSLIHGDNNTVNDSSSWVNGNNNESTGGNNLILGNGITADGDGVFLENAKFTNDGLFFNGILIAGPQVEIEYLDLLTLQNNSELQPGQTYNITDRDIFVFARSENEIDTNAIRRMRIVRDEWYTPQTVVAGFNFQYLGIYGQTINQGSVPNSSSTIGGNIYRAIWGGKLWQRNTSGADGGTSVNDIIDGGGWTQTSLTNDNFYKTEFFQIFYDLQNDFISRQIDRSGNDILGQIVQPTFGFSQALNPIDVMDWGNEGIIRNRTYAIFNNYQGTQKAVINNNTNNGYIFNNTNGGDITFNSNAGNINNNSNFSVGIGGGDISFNTNSGDIEFNSNNGPIISNANIGDIRINSNNGNINNNYTLGSIEINSNGGQINSNSCAAIRNNSNLGRIDGNSNRGNIENNANNGEILRNINRGLIENNNNNGSISLNKCLVISNNNNSGPIISNLNYGNIQTNSNSGEIINNTNAGNISGNGSNVLNIRRNGNTSDIENNNNSGQIWDNTNSGPIRDNTNSGTITRNFNGGAISNNSNGGFILENGNNWEITNNTNGGNILRNSNNGRITGNNNTSNIENNKNGGRIQNVSSSFTTVRRNSGTTYDITGVSGSGIIQDAIVNK